MCVIKNDPFYENMHFQYISHNEPFYVNSTIKYAVNNIPGHQKIESRTIVHCIWDTKTLVKVIKLIIAVCVTGMS